MDFFVGVVDGKANTLAFETSGKGFGGDIGLMIGVDTTTDKLIGISVTTHSETPGVGSKAKDDPGFSAQFKNLPIQETFQVKTDGGQIDAVSGATITSRGVCTAVTDAGKIYQELKPKLVERLKDYNK